MAIIASFDYATFDESDPADFRPNSMWALLVDPGRDPDARVDNITLIFEEIAPGDRIPLHTHPIHEVIVIDAGRPEVMLGDEASPAGHVRRSVRAYERKRHARKREAVTRRGHQRERTGERTCLASARRDPRFRPCRDLAGVRHAPRSMTTGGY